MIAALEATALQRGSLLTGPLGFRDYGKPLPLTGQWESFLNVSSDHILPFLAPKGKGKESEVAQSCLTL